MSKTANSTSNFEKNLSSEKIGYDFILLPITKDEKFLAKLRIS